MNGQEEKSQDFMISFRAQPTSELRFYGDVLQQKWVFGDNREPVWYDVPRVSAPEYPYVSMDYGTGGPLYKTHGGKDLTAAERLELVKYSIFPKADGVIPG